MSQPPQGGQDPQGGQPPQGQSDPSRGTAPQQGPGPQGPPQPGRPGQPPYAGQGYPQQGYPPQQGGYPPQQGYPQGPQAYPGQPPYAGGPGPQGPGYGVPPGGPQPYPGQPDQEPKKRRTGLFVLIGAGALALVLAVVAIAVNVGGRTESAGGGTSGGGAGGASSAPAAATASDAVNGYLQALAKGDAQTAVSYALDPSTVDTTYMTPAVLAASAKLAPLTGIQVGTSDPDATSVPVSYQLGSTRVDASVDVMKTSDDRWKLVTVATDLDLSAVQDSSVPMLMNGAKVASGPMSVLPGAYRFTTGQKYVDYGSRPDLLVRYPSDLPDTSQVSPRISSAGQKGAVAAVKKSWRSCLDKHAQKPKGCPNQFDYKDFNFKDSTVRWSRKGADPFKKIKPQYSDTTTLQYYVKRDLALKGTCTASGRTGTCTGTLKGTAQVEARFKGNKISVDWLT